MNGTLEELKQLTREKDFFVGIDSDGCVFDTMELKHKECFTSNVIKHFHLQSVSRFVREVWDHVNLYSQSRGSNRFLALIEAMDLLREREEIMLRGAKIPELPTLKKWVKEETRLGNPALEKWLSKNENEEMQQVLGWSKGINASVEYMVHNVAPFGAVKECLKKLNDLADCTVVSQTPFESIEREWIATGIMPYARFIAGQECGTKSEHLEILTKGTYDTDNVLMIGDAPGDYDAAKKVDALFFPIIPGAEDTSWVRLLEEAADHFFKGTYRGKYQESLLNDFQKALASPAPWKQ